MADQEIVKKKKSNEKCNLDDVRESNTTSHMTPTFYFLFFFFALMLNENVNCFRILRLYLLPYWGVFNYCHEHPPVHAHSSAFGCAAQQLDRYNRWTCTSYCCMPNGIASRFRPGRHFSHCIRHLSQIGRAHV